MTKPSKRKPRRMAAFRLRQDVVRLLERRSRETGKTKTRLVEEALLK